VSFYFSISTSTLLCLLTFKYWNMEMRAEVVNSFIPSLPHYSFNKCLLSVCHLSDILQSPENRVRDKGPALMELL
jgi:hypothetical protein